MKKILLLNVAILFILSACQSVRYEYLAPETTEGRQCVVQCASVRESCRANEIQDKKIEREACENKENIEYRICMQNAKNNPVNQKKCNQNRSSCFNSYSSANCNDEYRQCFEICGGKVIKIVEKL